MDSLAGLEPQLAIPVILVVVGAILVYIFGFKQTEEPSYEHLAVLQSSSSTFHKTRSAPSNNPKQQNNKASSGTNSGKANGHLPSANGSVANKKGVNINKENKPPTASTSNAVSGAVKGQGGQQTKKNNAKDPANKPEDFESGDWIPAVSRKEKTKVKKDVVTTTPSSPGKKGGYNNNRNKAAENWETGTTTTNKATDDWDTPPTVVKAPKIEDLLAEMNVLKEIERQNHSTQTTPDKKKVVSPTKNVAAADKKKVVAAPPPPGTAAAQEDKEEEDKVVAPAATPAQEKKAAPAPKKSNIAFDEMGGGDSWEEAKSRGAKKRTRARKD